MILLATGVCTFYIVEPTNTRCIYVGKNDTVGENVEVTIDCTEKIKEMRMRMRMRNNRSADDPIVTWYKNQMPKNENGNYHSSLVVHGENVTTDNYTCRVCPNDAENSCITSTSLITVCGEKCLPIKIFVEINVFLR